MSDLTDKEKADKLREAADLLDECGIEAGMNLRFKADALDPPAPVYPEGTIARVRLLAALPTLAERKDDRWIVDHQAFGDDDIEVVEVIPTLPRGHVAVPVLRTSPRVAAARLRAIGYGMSADVLDAYDDAAEASQR